VKTWCSVCNGYGGRDHRSTRSHLARVYRQANPRARKQPRPKRVRYESQFSLAYVTRVHKYRRRMPLDGAPKVVKVKQYWRSGEPARHRRHRRPRSA
jgi:hypothetical protein